MLKKNTLLKKKTKKKKIKNKRLKNLILGKKKLKSVKKNTVNKNFSLKYKYNYLKWKNLGLKDYYLKIIKIVKNLIDLSKNIKRKKKLKIFNELIKNRFKSVDWGLSGGSINIFYLILKYLKLEKFLLRSKKRILDPKLKKELKEFRKLKKMLYVKMIKNDYKLDKNKKKKKNANLKKYFKEYNRFRLERKKYFFIKRKLRYYMAWVNIKSSYNNIILTAKHNNNKILFWKSAGGLGFKGSQKSSFFAIKKTAKFFADKLKKNKINNIGLILKHKFRYIYHITKTFREKRLKILIIKRTKYKAFNGCRLKKKRRV